MESNDKRIKDIVCPLCEHKAKDTKAHSQHHNKKHPGKVNPLSGTGAKIQKEHGITPKFVDLDSI